MAFRQNGDADLRVRRTSFKVNGKHQIRLLGLVDESRCAARWEK